MERSFYVSRKAFFIGLVIGMAIYFALICIVGYHAFY